MDSETREIVGVSDRKTVLTALVFAFLSQEIPLIAFESNQALSEIVAMLFAILIMVAQISISVYFIDHLVSIFIIAPLVVIYPNLIPILLFRSR